MKLIITLVALGTLDTVPSVLVVLPDPLPVTNTVAPAVNMLEDVTVKVTVDAPGLGVAAPALV